MARIFCFVSLLFAYVLTTAIALSFPSYNPTADHPLQADPQFANIPKSPAIVKSFVLRKSTGRTVSRIYFLPSSTTYVTHRTGSPFATNLDALYIPRPSNKDATLANYLTIELNSPTRVILLLSSTNFAKTVLQMSHFSVTGLPASWSTPIALRIKSGKNNSFQTARMSAPRSFPIAGVAIQALVTGSKLVIPHPHKILVNGQKTMQYSLLFARPEALSTLPQAHSYQQQPTVFLDRTTGIMRPTTLVRPNHDCPSWVHDMYTSPTRDAKIAKKENEKLHWKTWHPTIDPYFWCYFGHEHGSYPGKYKPMLGYTAYKTKDTSASSGRQIESNEGFKVFAIPMHDARKYVIIVVHLHLANSRRFSARHHTVIFAVLDENWKLELEFHMKGDFGFGFTDMVKPPHQMPLDQIQSRIRNELLKKQFHASRRFNVLDMSDFPASADPNIRYRGNLQPTEKNRKKIRMGRYEKWSTPLNSCTRNGVINRGLKQGFIFDVRNPSTAKSSLERPANPMTQLSGTSENRQMHIKKNGLRVGLEYCDFFRGAQLEEFGKSEGVFFTDSYFSTAKETSGEFHIRQFIKPGFQALGFKGNSRLNTVGAWYGHFDFVPKGQRALNPENAILASKN